MLLSHVYSGFRWIYYGCSFIKRTLTRPADYIIIELEGNYNFFPEPQNFLKKRFAKTPPAILNLKKQLKTISNDPRLTGVVLKQTNFNIPYTYLDEVIDALKILKNNNKKLYSWAKNYSTSGYFLASYCDEIFLQPGGKIDELGFLNESFFLKDALNQLGIEFDIFKISPYKTASDFLIRSNSSKEAREMNQWIMNSIYDNFINNISWGRKKTKQEMEELVNNAPYTDNESLELGLIDKILGEEDLVKFLKPLDKKESKKIQHSIKIENFKSAHKKLYPPRPKKSKGSVGLVKIEGMIIDGRSKAPQNYPPIPIPLIAGERAGDLTITEQLRKLGANPKIKGIIVFIDSGGGSALASESIAYTIRSITRQKPVIALLGEKAASGGYYVASQADYIVSYPTTLTGSIGVVAGKAVNTNLLNKLLINREINVRGNSREMFYSHRVFNDREREKMQEGLMRTYNLFLERVCEGRKMTKAQLDPIAKGKVWTGEQALAKGLVDELGGFEETKVKMKELTGLSKFSIYEPKITERYQISKFDEQQNIVNYSIEGLKLFDGKKPLCIAEELVY
ncbi:signal peptide peptidase SppA [Natranaerobius thermophilus]|uniref:Acid phosphatase n=1 Tax=Natranaerobius thermophilus (strain ATCC BAA-1301 / DSM 18059 / JW/NM-WN-LF) TaxID=457570 RepID=B2A5G3_NATTJ|nr:signal peptide peptidase SppA [Natranaerobius thermophilus]ACB85318.1 Acid phosphatase [Natranaerobius thermophilus JW/NM-WN-LF]